MKKRLISLLLVLSMALSLFPVTALAATTPQTMSREEKDALLRNPFGDVAEDSWCFDAVQYARINGFFNGTTEVTFAPNDTMTRGMFVTVLGRMVGVDVDAYDGKPSFEDVPETKYYAPYVAWASKYGITLGVDESHFNPNGKITRQQMAAFFVRYFEAFDVKYETDANITTIPKDIDKVSDYAKDAVLKLWKNGLLNGDGKNFNPARNATRAQTATLCMRTDESVETWYKEPGVPSDRVRINPMDLKRDDIVLSDRRTVTFWDGRRQIAEMELKVGEVLSEMPTVEQYSKPGAILEGYYLDEEFTKPFDRHHWITHNTNVYAKYLQMESQMALNLTTFTQMDQSPNLSFRIKRVSGEIEPEQAVSLATKDGTDTVALSVVEMGDSGVYRVYAPDGFREGSTYELTLAEGWIFEGKADTIRTASFSIKMDEVENLRMSDDIVYIADTEALDYTVYYKINKVQKTAHYPVLTSDALAIEGADPTTISGEVTYTTYSGKETIEVGDLLCVYVGVHPNDRVGLSNDDDPTNDDKLMDPVVYVKITAIDGKTLTFGLMNEEDQQKLYEVPDLFPFMVQELPTGDGSLSVNISGLDISMYETAVGKAEGTLRKAKGKVGAGDFVVFYTQLDESNENNKVQYGLITDYDSDTGIITYTICTEKEMLDSMDLYSTVDVQGADLVSDAQKAQLEQSLYEQVVASNFAEEAAYLLSDLITKTDNFRDDLKIQDILLTDSEGNVLSDEDIQLMNLGSSFELTDEVKLTVELINKGEQLHFNDGVQLAIGLDANFEVQAEDGKVAIDLSATFVQEAMIKPSVKGEMTYTKILGIKFPNGVQVNANVDIKNYTALSFAAEIYTVANAETSKWDALKAMMKDPTSVLGLPGIPAELADGLETVGDVMDKIEELQNAVDRGTLAANKAREYTEDIDILWSALENNNLADREEWEELGEALGKTSITSDLMDMMNLSNETGLSTEYYDSLNALFEKYEETVTKETDWIKLLEEQIFAMEVCICGICIGVEANFVVRADMSIAIGSNLEYEVGKRYSFWFRIGLYTPTAGNDTTDLIDEKFAFQFYVMGKLGVKAGVSAELYVGIGTKSIASVGIRAELGPYIKLWGFFVYEYSKHRPANTQKWTYHERMMGGLFMEFGLYFMLSFEAQALGLFEYSHDFLDEEIPLLTAGDDRYYYDFTYEAATDEVVLLYDENADLSDGVSMQLPEEIRALSYLELTTGKRGSQVLPYDKFLLRVSNPRFSVTPDGKVTAQVPDNTRYMECELTITYRHSKMAFSNYDMSVTVPLVWTNLALSELKEYYTVSVRVGSGNHYDTVWSQKVLKNQEFDLPSDAEIKELIGWTGANDLCYVAGTGYGSQQTTGLAVNENTSYTYNIGYRTYNLTVSGIEKPNGDTYSETFTAEYGKAFDFSDLKTTGSAVPGKKYTSFANVTTDATISVKGADGKTTQQVIDLTQPINAKVAAALHSGNVSATANYVDNSIKAIFTLCGITYDEDTDIVKDNEVTLIMAKGEVPNAAIVEKAVEDHPGDEGVIISGITPAVSAIDRTTGYMVTCVRPSGERNMVHFDLQDGLYSEDGGETTATEIDPMNKLVGSLLVNLPDAIRTGYDFDGWFTVPKVEENNFFETKEFGKNSGENALTQTVPDRQFEQPEEGEQETTPAEIPYKLYAQWTPKAYKLTFDLNGGNQLIMETVDGVERNVRENDGKWEASMVYTHAFGNYYAYTENAKNLKGLSASEMYNGLPVAYSEETCDDPDNVQDKVGVSFSGWYYDFDGDGNWFEDGEEVTDDMIYNFAEDVTLKARWRTKVAIPWSVFSFTQKTVTYDGGRYEPARTFHGGTGHYYYLDQPQERYPLDYPAADDGYTIDYKLNTDVHQATFEYVQKNDLPHVAGTYDVRVEREADENFARMSWYNPYQKRLIINKKAVEISSATLKEPVVNGAAVYLSYSILNGDTSDGPVQYSIDGGSTWSSGAFYNLATGTYSVMVRRGEGMNYTASNAVSTGTSFTISATKKYFEYAIIVHTADVDSAGTDSELSAVVGGTETPLVSNESGDRFEKNDTDTCFGIIPNTFKLYDKDSVTVTIKADKGGNKPGWKLHTLQMALYEKTSSSLALSWIGAVKEVNLWFQADNDDWIKEKAFDIGIKGRGLSGNAYGLSMGRSGGYDTISINDTITDNYKSDPYDPLYYSNAPKLVAYFDKPIFDKYIIRTGLYSYSIDTSGLEAAMEEYRIKDLKLNYGISYASNGGVMGAPDYMLSKTYSYGLTI